MTDIAGKVIVVTGVTGNLGAAVMTRARAAGAKVAGLGRSEASLEKRFPDAAKDADILLVGGVDLGDLASVDDALAKVAERFGRIDALMNTVGGFDMGTLADDSFATWTKLQAMNVETAFNVTKAISPHLKRNQAGAIVHVGAIAGLQSCAGLSAYSASKAGVLRLVEAVAEEVRADGIRINAVLPGTIDTPQNREAMPDADRSAWVSPAAIADAMLMLAGESARAVTGALIPVTGRG